MRKKLNKYYIIGEHSFLKQKKGNIQDKVAIYRTLILLAMYKLLPVPEKYNNILILKFILHKSRFNGIKFCNTIF